MAALLQIQTGLKAAVAPHSPRRTASAQEVDTLLTDYEADKADRNNLFQHNSVIGTADAKPSANRTNVADAPTRSPENDLHQDTHLLTYDELPPWLRNNSDITSKYLPPELPLTTVIAKAFTVHTETSHIWSHLLPSLLFSLPLAHLLLAPPPQASIADIVVAATYLVSAIACFALSTVHHILLNYTPSANAVSIRLDHLGIVGLIWGSTLSSAHFSMICHPELRQQYLGLCTALAVLSAHFTLRPTFASAEGGASRIMNFTLYTFMGLCAFAAPVHALALNGFANQWAQAGLGWFIALAIADFTGAVAYAVRFPERWAPGRFDVGGSHLIMHVLVVAGAGLWTKGILNSLGWWADVRAAGEMGSVCGWA